MISKSPFHIPQSPLPNVVGYQDINIKNKYQFFTVTFENLQDATKFDLTDIKCKKPDGSDWVRTGAAANACNGAIYVHKIAQNGAYGKHYVYYGKNASDTFGPGWYLVERDAEGTNLVKQGEVTLNPGEGLMVWSNKADDAAKFVISGGVKLEPFNGKIKNKYQFGGNCTPVTVDLSKIKCLKPDGSDWLRTGAAANACNGAIYLHKIAQNGAYGKHYVYYGKNASDTFGPGWYLVERDAEGENLVKEGDVTFAPGEGWLLWSNKADDAAILELPKPIPDAN